VLAEMVRTGAAPGEVVERRGLEQVSDPDRLGPVIDQILERNAPKVEEYRAGRTGLLGFFVGQVMEATGGRANPELTKRLIQERVGSGGGA
jgi:Asp-tRNA(Asn)/Glu-tRNA(Gln) amidotransferase B subunit